MPNWVLNKISVEEQYAEKLEEISKIGIGRYYNPMPEDLNKTKAPLNFEGEEQETAVSFLEKYGFRDWYSWAVANWGTKWGCYDQDLEADQINFTTAWDTLSDDVLDRLAKHFPNMIFYYEEEQGWGGEIVYKNGTQYSHERFDIPKWDAHGQTQNGVDVYRLAENYTKIDERYDSGWYYHQNLEEPVDASDKILNIEEY